MTFLINDGASRILVFTVITYRTHQGSHVNRMNQYLAIYSTGPCGSYLIFIIMRVPLIVDEGFDQPEAERS